MWFLSDSELKVKVAQSYPTFVTHGLYSSWNSPGQNTGVGSLSLFQGIFPTQGSNPGLPHCRRILYQLSHKEGQTARQEGKYRVGERRKGVEYLLLFIS